MKLEFGNKEHIALKKRIEAELQKKDAKRVADRLLKVVKCPFCGAKADNAYSIDWEEKVIGWNFKCATDPKGKCPNSIEYGEKNGYEDERTQTDFEGNFIDEDEYHKI